MIGLRYLKSGEKYNFGRNIVKLYCIFFKMKELGLYLVQ
jgi:hypothetical protein